MDKIKLILNEELKKERDNYLIESIQHLSKINNKEIFDKKLKETTLNLINDGYDFDEISVVIEQTAAQTNTGLFGNLIDPATGKFNIWNTLFGGGESALKEQIIRFILVDILGLKELTGQSLAVFFADNKVRLRDFIKIFRSHDMCVQHIPNIAEGIVEVIINNAQFKGASQQSTTLRGATKVGLRNILMESVRESTLGETLGAKFCNYIWKENTETQTNQTPNPQPIV